jgi:hypothetical protein
MRELGRKLAGKTSARRGTLRLGVRNRQELRVDAIAILELFRLFTPSLVVGILVFLWRLARGAS